MLSESNPNPVNAYKRFVYLVSKEKYSVACRIAIICSEISLLQGEYKQHKPDVTRLPQSRRRLLVKPLDCLDRSNLQEQLTRRGVKPYRVRALGACGQREYWSGHGWTVLLTLMVNGEGSYQRH
ncbi:hypothetical protein PoB_001091600 [Plakobranchus ocellatus]|uniref:Uncharacterized protein n=1 Tax=Plakobranchus ocellatus TaxID=259542 RepID=A0AAV3YAU7_9GAST|nr:hypothetical protein PoB_001091600 [Plakobranchus ocellatus]